MNTVSTTSGVPRAQASSADVNFLYRVKGAPVVGESLPATSQSLKTDLHVSGLGEFLQGQAVIQDTGSAVQQMRMDLGKQLRFLLIPAIFRQGSAR
jgi:hypothetical protein